MPITTSILLYIVGSVSLYMFVKHMLNNIIYLYRAHKAYKSIKEFNDYTEYYLANIKDGGLTHKDAEQMNYNLTRKYFKATESIDLLK